MTWLRGLAACLLLTACAHHAGLLQQPLSTDGARPQLCWEAFPPEVERKADTDGCLAGLSDVTYDLRIFANDGTIAVDLVGLKETCWPLQRDLVAGATYYWTVRPRFRLDGRVRVGQWSMVTNQPWASSVLPVPVNCYPFFRVPLWP